MIPYYFIDIFLLILFSLYIYVMIITGDDLDDILALKLALVYQFVIKRFGIIMLFSEYWSYLYFGYLQSQPKYILDIYDRECLCDNKIVNAFIEINA